MIKIITSVILLLVGISFSSTTFADSKRANSLKRTLNMQYDRMAKATDGKLKIMKNIDILNKRYKKDKDVTDMLNQLAVKYGISVNCASGKFLQDGTCIVNIAQPVNSSINNELKTVNITTNGDNKGQILEDIQSIQTLIDSAKNDLENGRAYITKLEGQISIYENYNAVYLAKIEKTKSDYASVIYNTKNQIDILIQQDNVKYANLGIQRTVQSALAAEDKIRNENNKLIDDLKFEMNNNIALLQIEINKNNLEIQSLRSQIENKMNRNNELQTQIVKTELSLAELKKTIN